jgi:Domain of unknown function (DUF4062)
LPNNPKTLERVRIFCASPGDVSDAREVVEETVRQLDKIWRERGVTLQFDGWEGTGPSAGRPQDEINALVDASDVFVGLLNGRWGFPTGAHKSGFEEEYERAAARLSASGTPELCVFFTELSSRDPQAPLVEAFRQRLQTTQEAYYRAFADLDELREIVHRRLEGYLTARLKLGPTDEREAPVDWATALSAGPVGQLPDGATREREAGDMAGRDPAGAAAILEQLAAELSSASAELGPSAQQLLEEAAALRHQAGEVDVAVERLVSVVRARASDGNELARLSLQLLRQWLPDEAQWIADAWEALLVWPEQPQDSVSRLRIAIASEQHELVSDEDRLMWREQLGEILLWGDQTGDALTVLKGLQDLAADNPDSLVRLHCLAAEALGFAGDGSKAADHWDRLLTWVDDHGNTRPAIAGVVLARHAVGLVRHERLAGAQRDFRAAAEHWAAAEGAAGEVAEQHFSASVAADLLGDFSSRPDFNRAQAVSLRSTTNTPERVAERLLRQGLEERVTGRAFEALNRLTLAAQVHRRAGHLRGELHATRVLCELFEHTKEHDAALAAAIQCGAREETQRLAPTVAPEALVNAIDLDGPGWVLRTSLNALGVAGRRLSATESAAIAPAVLAAAQAPVEFMAERDRQVAAVEAAAALVHEWPANNRDAVVALLAEAAASADFLRARPAVQALILRTNAAEGDHVEELVEIMLTGPSPGQVVSPMWVGSYLHDRPEIVERLREAGANDSLPALESLCMSEHVLELGERVVTAIERRVRNLLSVPLGHTSEGHIIGFLRLEPWGSIARHASDEGLREEFARALMELILNDSEPHANRASGANALHNLAPGLSASMSRSCVERLRPLAEGHFGSSAHDVPREVAEHPFNRFRLGDEAAADRLNAAALTACASLIGRDGAGKDAVPWLVDAINEALISDEPVVVAGAWEAVWRADAIAVPDALPVHLLHPAHEVRVAALACWRVRRDDALPVPIAKRLARDDHLDVRTALLGLLREGDRAPELRSAMASGDPDSYVRAVAAAPIRQQPPRRGW